ncbi:MAG TPA: hypothetical protein VGM51_07240 [Armatimonadota bacterium]
MSRHIDVARVILATALAMLTLVGAISISGCSKPVAPNPTLVSAPTAAPVTQRAPVSTASRTPLLDWWRAPSAHMPNMPKRTEGVQIAPDIETARLFWPAPNTLIALYRRARVDDGQSYNRFEAFDLPSGRRRDLSSLLSN